MFRASSVNLQEDTVVTQSVYRLATTNSRRE